MKDIIYAWMMGQIEKPFTQERAEAVYNVLYLLFVSGYQAPEWEAVVYWLADGEPLAVKLIINSLQED